MAKKKEETKPAAKASEAAAPKAEAPKAEAPKAKAPKAPVKKSAKKAKTIKVQPTTRALRDMNEPFQGILIRLGVETPVEETSWINSQIEAGLLEKC